MKQASKDADGFDDEEDAGEALAKVVGTEAWKAAHKWPNLLYVVWVCSVVCGQIFSMAN